MFSSGDKLFYIGVVIFVKSQRNRHRQVPFDRLDSDFILWRTKKSKSRPSELKWWTCIENKFCVRNLSAWMQAQVEFSLKNIWDRYDGITFSTMSKSENLLNPGNHTICSFGETIANIFRWIFILRMHSKQKGLTHTEYQIDYRDFDFHSRNKVWIKPLKFAKEFNPVPLLVFFNCQILVTDRRSLKSRFNSPLMNCTVSQMGMQFSELNLILGSSKSFG